MPIYEYSCKACKRTLEIIHSMAACDEPDSSVIENTSCHYDRDCSAHWHALLGSEQPTDKDLRFERVIQLPQILGSYGGSSLSGKEKLATIQGERKERSHKDFKKEIFPTLPKQEKKHFEKKWKKQGRD